MELSPKLNENNGSEKLLSYWSSGIILKALAKLSNIAWETLWFVSESLAMDKKVTPYLRRKIVFGKQCWPVSEGLKTNFIGCSSRDGQNTFLCQHKTSQTTLVDLPTTQKSLFFSIKIPDQNEAVW